MEGGFFSKEEKYRYVLCKSIIQMPRINTKHDRDKLVSYTMFVKMMPRSTLYHELDKLQLI